jgi:hypothetical protein
VRYVSLIVIVVAAVAAAFWVRRGSRDAVSGPEPATVA